MLLLKKTFQPDHIWFADDIFALKPHWTERFSQAVQRLDAAIPFQMQSRVDLMNRSTVRSLAAAGCEEVWMGAESGSQRILDAMDKGSRIEQIFSARQNLKSAGIRACFFLQFGYPGETWKDIQLTIDLIRRAQPDDIGISVSYPLPGTKFYSLVQGDLKSKTNWEDSEDLAMMFRGTYTAEFYRALHDALHLEVELTNIVLHNGGPPVREPTEEKFEDYLRQLMDLWLLVGQLESRCRNGKPTRLEETPSRQSTLKAVTN
jgi:radical SAM superfamily enzyme YgiQ (UPF0313 family)